LLKQEASFDFVRGLLSYLNLEGQFRSKAGPISDP